MALRASCFLSILFGEMRGFLFWRAIFTSPSLQEFPELFEGAGVDDVLLLQPSAPSLPDAEAHTRRCRYRARGTPRSSSAAG
jgi:hypothetical protein